MPGAPLPHRGESPSLRNRTWVGEQAGQRLYCCLRRGARGHAGTSGGDSGPGGACPERAVLRRRRRRGGRIPAPRVRRPGGGPAGRLRRATGTREGPLDAPSGPRRSANFAARRPGAHRRGGVPAAGIAGSHGGTRHRPRRNVYGVPGRCPHGDRRLRRICPAQSRRAVRTGADRGDGAGPGRRRDRRGRAARDRRGRRDRTAGGGE